MHRGAQKAAAAAAAPHRITEELLSSSARGVAPAELLTLNLHGNNIRKVEFLTTLVLSFNEIHKIERLDELKCLERLELGFTPCAAKMSEFRRRSPRNGRAERQGSATEVLHSTSGVVAA